MSDPDNKITVILILCVSLHETFPYMVSNLIQLRIIQ